MDIDQTTLGARKYTWIKFLIKNKPQIQAVATGLLLTFISGCHIGWGIFNPYKFQSNTHSESTTTINAFYFGSVLGTVVAQVWIKNYGDKRKIYGTAVILFLISCISFVYNAKQFYFQLTARLIGGIAHSLNYITVVIHISEVAVKEKRGMIVSCLSHFTQVSVFTTFIIIYSGREFAQNVTLSSGQITFGLGIIFAATASIFIFVLYYDSPYLMIQQGQDSQALKAMMALRSEHSETWEIKNEYHEMKTMIEEDSKLTASILTDGNIRPLALVTLSSLVQVLTFNYALNVARIHVTLLRSRSLQPSAVAYILIRCTVGLCALIVFDKYRRRSLQINTGMATGIILIISGIIVLAYASEVTHIVIFCIFEIMCALGLGSMSDVLSSEAFPLTKKLNSLVFKTNVENLLHIILIAATFGMNFTETSLTAIFMTTGVCIIIIIVVLWKELPDTRQMSLRQARAEFRKMGDTLYSGNNKPSGIVYS